MTDLPDHDDEPMEPYMPPFVTVTIHHPTMPNVKTYEHDNGLPWFVTVQLTSPVMQMSISFGSVADLAKWHAALGAEIEAVNRPPAPPVDGQAVDLAASGIEVPAWVF